MTCPAPCASGFPPCSGKRGGIGPAHSSDDSARTSLVVDLGDRRRLLDGPRRTPLRCGGNGIGGGKCYEAAEHRRHMR
jgi:hypothetical protein